VTDNVNTVAATHPTPSAQPEPANLATKAQQGAEHTTAERQAAMDRRNIRDLTRRLEDGWENY
jgi:hypothetical protein